MFTSIGGPKTHVTLGKDSVMPELSQLKAEFFKALAHPLRVRILDALRDGEVAVTELSPRLGVEQSTLGRT
jgi:DNA-binding transcriptional ArsR family regulator